MDGRFQKEIFVNSKLTDYYPTFFFSFKAFPLLAKYSVFFNYSIVKVLARHPVLSGPCSFREIGRRCWPTRAVPVQQNHTLLFTSQRCTDTSTATTHLSLFSFFFISVHLGCLLSVVLKPTQAVVSLLGNGSFIVNWTLRCAASVAYQSQIAGLRKSTGLIHNVETKGTLCFFHTLKTRRSGWRSQVNKQNPVWIVLIKTSELQRSID